MSSPAKITSIDVPIAVSVVGGEYAINCDSNNFTSTTSTIAENDTLCLRHTSSSEFGSSVTTTITIGDLVTSFSSTTLEADRLPDDINLVSKTNAALSSEQISEMVTVNGINTPVVISVGNGEYAINCDENSFTAAQGTIENGESFCVKHTSSSSYSTRVTTTVNIGEGSASFSSTTLANPNSGSNTGSSSGNSDSSGSMFWFLPLLLIGLTRRVTHATNAC